ncbi:MAG TPA: hypothetical protein VHM19_11125 [Polyangiales bacterium]|jgi:hypothetical protein|nr:hypothetical protein [Polyangiales bacterium]
MHTGSHATDSERPPAPTHNRSRASRAFKLTKLRTDGFYFSVEEFAHAFGWPVRRSKRHIRRCGIAIKRGGHWYSTRGLIRRFMPEEADELIALLEHMRAGGTRPKSGLGQLTKEFYLPVDEAAHKLGILEDTLRKRLARQGGAVKRGGRWYATRGVLLRVVGDDMFRDIGGIASDRFA